MKRSLFPYIEKDLRKKIILLTGPRQSGKTTLAKMLASKTDHFNYDNVEHRLRLKEKSWDRKAEVVIFDELHKMKKWKTWLKGVYDTEKIPPALVVTGSARLDTMKKVGDSMAGRFFEFRLHPLDLKEAREQKLPGAQDEQFTRLLNIGGFPEPYLESDPYFYGRWQRSHLDIILKQDLIDLEGPQQILNIETLIELLRRGVTSPVSVHSLTDDLHVSDKTVRRWLQMLENMYVVFRVPPFHKNVARALLKASKYYFFDNGRVSGDDGQKLENLTACALLKEIQFRQDCLGQAYQLNYLRVKEGREVDFVVLKNGAPCLFVETKWSDDNLSPALSYWDNAFPKVPKVQLVGQIGREKTYARHIEVRSAAAWLSEMPLP